MARPHAEHPQGIHLYLLVWISLAHERTDRGGSGVENGHLELSMICQNRPASGYVGTPSNMRDVAPLASARTRCRMAGHPADVCGAPVDIGRGTSKITLAKERNASDIGGGMHHALGFSR